MTKVTKKMEKGSFVESLKGKVNTLPKDAKELHKVLASFRKVKDEKGNFHPKKELCYSFGIAYHTPKIVADKVTLCGYKTFKVESANKDNKYDTLVLCK